MVAATATDLLTQIGTTLTSVLQWIGSVITSMTDSAGSLAPLLPVLCIAIGISLVLLVIKIVRKMCWGA